MADIIRTELGKIYCKYNEEKDDYDIKRVIGVNNEKGTVTMCNCDADYKLTQETKKYTNEEYKEFRRSWIELKSDGIISRSNVLSISAEEFGRDVDDVILMFFPNSKETNVPTIDNFRAVARQGITNIFADMAGQSDIVGVSVTIDTVPAGYALSDFIENKKVYDTKLTHFYKIDNCESMAKILDSKKTHDILNDLYNTRVHYLENTNVNFKHIKLENNCIDGYCNSLVKFLDESGFIMDVKYLLGIIKMDFDITENNPITGDDLTLLSVTYGGIKMYKTIPMKFDYYVDLNAIKMKYILVEDKSNTLYIVGYTDRPDMVDPIEEQQKVDDRLDAIYGRLCNLGYSVTPNNG